MSLSWKNHEGALRAPVDMRVILGEISNWEAATLAIGDAS